MTRMERRRRRRRILRIKLATTAAVLALTTASIVALTGGAAETAPEPTPQPPVLQAEPVLLVAEHDSTYQPVQMTAEPAQEPEPIEEEDENEKIEAALLEQGYLHEEIPLDFDLQCHLITVCEEYGVPQNVALGVIQAESSFTATAANGSCYGYMQINSINSEWLSEKIGVTDLTDPYQNIRSGVFILSDLYGKYGDWHKALICYNYGEGGAQEHVFSKRLCITASPKRSWKWLRRRNLNPKLRRKPAIPFLPATSPISPVKSDAIRRHSRHTDRQVRKWHGSAYTKVSTGRSCGICISSSVAQSSRRRAS